MAKNAINPVEENPVEKKAKSVKKAKPANSEVVNVDPGTGKPLPKWTTVISKKGKMTNKKYVESTVRPAFEALVLGVKQYLIAEGKIDAEDNTFDYEVWVYKDHDRKQQCVEIHMIGEDAIHYLYDDPETVNAFRASVKLNMVGVMGKVPNPVRVYDEGEKYFIIY